MTTPGPAVAAAEPNLISSQAPPSRWSAGEAWTAFAWAALTVAAGLLVISASYAAGRGSLGWGKPVYWLGQALVYLPVLWALLRPRPLRDAQAAGLVVLLVGSQYLIKWMYSPVELKFPDELQHWRQAGDTLAADHLFQQTYALPVARGYPGLEAVAAAVHDLTGLSITAAALLIMMCVRLLLGGAVYLVARDMPGSPRTAGLSVALYVTNSHAQFFDAMFLYQAIALPFLFLVTWAGRRWARGEGRSYLLVTGLAMVVVVACHHVTAFVMVVVLLLVALADVAGSRNAADGRSGFARLGRIIRRRTVGLAAMALAVVAGWVLLVSPDTLSYLSPVLSELGDSAKALLGSSSGAQAPPPLSGPPQDRVVALASTGLLAVLVLLAGRICWRRWTDAWGRAMVVGAGFLYVLLAIRQLASDGDELAGRGLTFVYLPVSIVLATAATGWIDRWRGRRDMLVAALALGGVLMTGGLVTGWPPYWERLPGPYQVGAFESSVEPKGKQAARWALEELSQGNRWYADTTNYTLLSTYGNQDAVRSGADLYYALTFRPADRRKVAHDAVRYVLADWRLTTDTPRSGSYFPVDPRANRHRTPLDPRGLAKFDRVPGVSRIYDGGDIKGYDLRGSAYDDAAG